MRSCAGAPTTIGPASASRAGYRWRRCSTQPHRVRQGQRPPPVSSCCLRPRSRKRARRRRCMEGFVGGPGGGSRRADPGASAHHAAVVLGPTPRRRFRGRSADAVGVSPLPFPDSVGPTVQTLMHQPVRIAEPLAESDETRFVRRYLVRLHGPKGQPVAEVRAGLGDHLLQSMDEAGHRSAERRVLGCEAQTPRDRMDLLEDGPPQLLVRYGLRRRGNERRIVLVHPGQPCLFRPPQPGAGAHGVLARVEDAVGGGEPDRSDGLFRQW